MTASHWENVYSSKPANEVSWFQPEARLSLELIAARRLAPDAAILDVGAGASRLVDGLLKAEHRDVTLLDIANAALTKTRERLGTRDEVSYVIADVASWTPPREFALWHDRAVFHFLVDEEARNGYRRALQSALPLGAWAVMATFALDGPERCSGLPVQRYSPQTLAESLGASFRLRESRSEAHATPGGASQSFSYAVFERVG
jgi:hypothetical protein